MSTTISFMTGSLLPGQDPCQIPGAICATRNYAQILQAESDMAVRHMLTFNKWPHYFHQPNLAPYDASGNTLQFDWLSAVFTAYEQLFKLPVKNFPFYLIGDRTAERLTAKSAVIQAVWNRTTNQVTLSANKSVPNLTRYGCRRWRFVWGSTYPRNCGKRDGEDVQCQSGADSIKCMPDFSGPRFS